MIKLKMSKRRQEESDDDEYDEDYNPHENYLKSLSKSKRNKLMKLEFKILKENEEKIPLRYKILNSSLDFQTKVLLMNKILYYEKLTPMSSEYFKLKKYMEGLLKIPFNNYIDLPINNNHSSTKISDFISTLKKNLDNCTYGQYTTKESILNIIGKWISNPVGKTMSLGICGPPGVGKTTLIKDGLSKSLKIPISFIPLGGSSSGAILEGHDYTWEGSKWGRIVDILMEKKCMNPIIFFDELDKISETKQGDEITGILTHLTDISQNNCFTDKYFAGINFDLSKAIFIFSFNDVNKINPILRDRLNIVNIDKYNIDEKIHIAKKFSYPKLCKNINFDSNNIDISDELYSYIVSKYAVNEQGIRKLEKCIEKIIMKCNLYYLTKDKNNFFNLEYYFPIVLTTELIDKILKPYYEKYNSDTISSMYL